MVSTMAMIHDPQYGGENSGGDQTDDPHGAPPGAHVADAPPSQSKLSRMGDTFVLSAPVPPMPPQLSPSEQDVVRLLLAGESNAEIGESRKTSTKTAANQLHSIYRKLGVHSREELAAYVVGRKWLEGQGSDQREQLEA